MFKKDIIKKRKKERKKEVLLIYIVDVCVFGIWYVVCFVQSKGGWDHESKADSRAFKCFNSEAFLSISLVYLGLFLSDPSFLGPLILLKKKRERERNNNKSQIKPPWGVIDCAFPCPFTAITQ